jgi:hypothetical protein
LRVKWRPARLESPRDADKTSGKIYGGSLAFGGGVPPYRHKTRVGGLGSTDISVQRGKTLSMVSRRYQAEAKLYSRKSLG